MLETGLTGRRLGNYEVHEQLGSGGMAVVYRATQHPLGREVAVKVLAPAIADDPGLLPRFINEARTVARLDHPNILPVFDYGHEGDITYLVMPLVRGGTLRDRLRRGRLEPGEAWRVILQVGDALDHAHSAGIVHRDLKPNNVLMHSDGRALLADFGLARSTAGPSAHSAYGIAIGTAGYMAPEQATGQDLDHRADIHALGVMVFEMLTGRAPWRGANPMEVVIASVTKPMPSVREFVPSLPPELDLALARLTAKKPGDRPASVREAMRILAARPDPGSASTPITMRSVTPPPGHATVPPTPGTWAAPLSAPGTSWPAPASTPVPASTLGSPLPVALLSHLGLPRLTGGQRYFMNAYLATQVQSARAIAGEHWPLVVRAAAMGEYLNRDPATNDELASPVEQPSMLAEGLETVFGASAPDALRHWGALTTERWFAARRQRSLRFVPGGSRKVGAMLRDVTAGLDEVRGEHLHVARQIDDAQFWVVHYSNLTALGRRRGHRSCQYWLASYEVALGLAGLLNSWTVDEIECGCVTGSFDCLFAVRARRVAFESLTTIG